MRYLRSSFYLSLSDPPLTTVIAEADAADTLESARAQFLVPGGLVISDIFESSSDLKEATHEAISRQRTNAEQEGHQVLLYYWTLSHWRRLTKGGTLMMDKPAPMSRTEICVVFEQLAQHPGYNDFTIVSHDRTGEPVRLVSGQIEED